MTKTNIPQGITPYLIVRGAARAIDFYVRGFGAVETLRLVEPGKERVGHAELTIANAQVMLADEHPELGLVGPETRGGSSAMFSLHVEDVDAFAKRAVAAGAVLEGPVKDEFYGDRVASLRDPFGHRWSFHQRIEEVSNEEVKRRYAKLISG
jgi:PhnB protein